MSSLPATLSYFKIRENPNTNSNFFNSSSLRQSRGAVAGYREYGLFFHATLFLFFNKMIYFFWGLKWEDMGVWILFSSSVDSAHAHIL
jgi:hypothetical protein